MSHTYMFNLLPFNMFNLGIGLTIGYTKLNFNLYSGKSTGIAVQFEGVMIGLMYRFKGWFRIGFGYLASVGVDSHLLSGGIEEPLDEDESLYNFYTFIEVFVWKNLSLYIKYYYTETVHFDQLSSGTVDFRTHYVSLMVSFGLNVF